MNILVNRACNGMQLDMDLMADIHQPYGAIVLTCYTKQECFRLSNHIEQNACYLS